MWPDEEVDSNAAPEIAPSAPSDAARLAPSRTSAGGRPRAPLVPVGAQRSQMTVAPNARRPTRTRRARADAVCPPPLPARSCRRGAGPPPRRRTGLRLMHSGQDIERPRARGCGPPMSANRRDAARRHRGEQCPAFRCGRAVKPFHPTPAAAARPFPRIPCTWPSARPRRARNRARRRATRGRCRRSARRR